MKVILDSAGPKQIHAHIRVEYPQLKTETDHEDEYDEDEQLYTAVRVEANARKYQSPEIPVYLLQPELPVLAVVVPHLTNPIAEKLVAAEVAQLAPETSSWHILAPCVLNNGTSLSRLDVGEEFAQVPKLQPPHFITGIGAAVVSELAKKGGDKNLGVLVLNAEGHPGYEKVDADSIMDAAEVIGEGLVGKSAKPDYIKKLSQNVRKINSASTSGMYI